eukprot:CAMPEP_0204204682 /NCGR_PEP_ID=MMETSP0361-20130328/69806_1 /ASSEMBLY_ACC=CAM_ASM_000343 /TAXON_ID=268821 /ORGANISM="Scrippsiella Hangoei, Strain SHTV-5" /LENGTH=152 /DNA_ID=CAMNT_0051167831 /DNA_START=77 /DNA_END=535 /DNA_ORIENTATION=+
MLIVVAFVDMKQQRRMNKENVAMDAASAVGLQERVMRSASELNKFNGVDHPRVHFCIKGRIYDVSSSGNFVPGGCYSYLAGAEGTFTMARMTDDRSMVNCTDYDLLEEHDWNSVDGWVSYMDAKYKCIAHLREYFEWKEGTLSRSDAKDTSQ